MKTAAHARQSKAAGFAPRLITLQIHKIKAIQMPKITARVFQLAWLFQTVLWIFSVLGFDQGLSGFIQNNHTAWVVLYGVTTTLSIFHKVILLSRWIVESISEMLYSKKLIKIIKNLKQQDKFILSKFITENKKEILLHTEDSATEWLASNKIIIRTSSESEKKAGYKMAIWARDYLTKNPNRLY